MPIPPEPVTGVKAAPAWFCVSVVEAMDCVAVGAAKVYLSAELVALVPPIVVTVMSTLLPAVPAGALSTMLVAVSEVKVVTEVVPNLTAVALARLVPVMVTLVPPTAAPVEGLTPVTVGAAT